MRRYRIAAGLLLGSALLSWSLAQSDAVRYEVRLNELPMTLGPWEGRTEALTRADLVHAVLETSAVLSRTYVTRDGRGDRIDLLITYFERGHRGFHPPEVSFVASGHTIVRADRVGIPLTDGREWATAGRQPLRGDDADRRGAVPLLVRHRRRRDGELLPGLRGSPVGCDAADALGRPAWSASRSRWSGGISSGR